MISLMSKNVAWHICSGSSKVKGTLKVSWLNSRAGPANNYALMHGFENNLAQLCFLMYRSAIWMICSDGLKAKVTREGQIFKQS